MQYQKLINQIVIATPEQIENWINTKINVSPGERGHKSAVCRFVSKTTGIPMNTLRRWKSLPDTALISLSYLMRLERLLERN